ncbi:MAG: zinc metallopeptidase [Bacteroides sp.]|nr:MAG: zinc metallopeptidase [Bacteroides sp.]
MNEYLVILPIIIGTIFNFYFQYKAKKYSKIKLLIDMTGKDIALRMLKDHNIYNVAVVVNDGYLTDHYDPEKKIISLSHDVYFNKSILSAAISAHECGHAVQDAQTYQWLNYRSNMIPILSITNNIVMWILFLGVILINIFPIVIWIGIIMFGFTTIFSIINLPIEFDASDKALKWLNKNKIVHKIEFLKVKSALNYAAITYVIAMFASVSTLLHYVLIALNNDKDN